jgi:hypothetical protein
MTLIQQLLRKRFADPMEKVSLSVFVASRACGVRLAGDDRSWGQSSRF